MSQLHEAQPALTETSRGQEGYDINEQVTFTLTPTGRNVVEAYYTEIAAMELDEGLKAELLAGIPARLGDNSDGEVTMQLWEVMSILGPATHHGGPQLIESNRITFKTS